MSPPLLTREQWVKVGSRFSNASGTWWVETTCLTGTLHENVKCGAKVTLDVIPDLHARPFGLVWRVYAQTDYLLPEGSDLAEVSLSRLIADLDGVGIVPGRPVLKSHIEDPAPDLSEAPPVTPLLEARIVALSYGMRGAAKILESRIEELREKGSR